MSRKVSILILVVLLPYLALSQGDALYLSKDDVVSIVKKYHPVIKQANARVEQAKAKLLESRGAFDPNLGVGYDRKTFDGDLYYSYYNPELRIPTWYGIELKAGLEEVAGSRYFSELTQGKTSYAGVKLSVLDGLVLDARRATLRQARAMQQLSEAEQELVINNILFEAVSAYWNWVLQYQLYSIYSDVVSNNEERMKLVRLEYVQGNRPAIDTVEAKTQLQMYQQQQQEAYMEFVNAGYELSRYLWVEKNLPVEWTTIITPDTTALHSDYSLNDLPGIEDVITQSMLYHPKLKAVDNKIDFLQIEKRLKAQAILPKLDVNANLLNKGYDLPDELTMPFLENNYKFGVDFSLPLFLRKERGAYKAAKFKVLETELERDYTSVQIENKVRSYYNEVLVLRNQVSLYEDAYRNYAKMFRGEQTRYNVGEGTLFLVNTRENKLLQARSKLLELKVKWHKSYAGLLWSAAIM